MYGLPLTSIATRLMVRAGELVLVRGRHGDADQAQASRDDPLV